VKGNFISNKGLVKSQCLYHNINSQHGPSKYNSGMLGAQSKYESPCATF
jgi:homogentisate 1,2-dioxygenase